MTSKSVFIVGGHQGYKNMFINAGWEVEDSIRHADLIQFCGGEDVTPALYGHGKHSKTICSPERDATEKLVFELALAERVPMAGICRGGQFLNVMCGGEMWQHVNMHSQGMYMHPAKDEWSNDTFRVSSTHHQMMIPSDEACIILTAMEATRKEKVDATGHHNAIVGKNPGKGGQDVEAVWYPAYNTFCFQPHPEFQGCEELAERYFDYIESLLFEFYSEGRA